MSDVTEGARTALAGFEMLGKGMSDLGQSNLRRDQAAKIKELIKGTEGEVLAADLRRGATASDVLTARENRAAISPTNLIGKLLQKGADPDLSEEERIMYRKQAAEIAGFVRSMNASSGGDSGEAGENILQPGKQLVKDMLFVSEMDKRDSVTEEEAKEVKAALYRISVNKGGAAFGKELGGDVLAETPEATSQSKQIEDRIFKKVKKGQSQSSATVAPTKTLPSSKDEVNIF